MELNILGMLVNYAENKAANVNLNQPERERGGYQIEPL